MQSRRYVEAITFLIDILTLTEMGDVYNIECCGYGKAKEESRDTGEDGENLHLNQLRCSSEGRGFEVLARC
jgi:hypothetical protein